MANYTAADVKKLRDTTGAGMMDAKKALVEADGDFAKATELLRIKGTIKNEKRGAERTASNGLIAAAEGVMIELNFWNEADVAELKGFDPMTSKAGAAKKKKVAA